MEEEKSFLEAVIEENKRLQQELAETRRAVFLLVFVTALFCALDALIIVKFWL